VSGDILGVEKYDFEIKAKKSFALLINSAQIIKLNSAQLTEKTSENQ
jgi:hypothetical protein